MGLPLAELALRLRERVEAPQVSVGYVEHGPAEEALDVILWFAGPDIGTEKTAEPNSVRLVR
jgi:hypothetical protein